MSDYATGVFLNRAGRPNRTIHLVERPASKLWKGKTWCGRLFEPAGGKAQLVNMRHCRACAKRAG